MMRARSWALRDGFADVLRGLSIREEVEDYDTRGTPLAEPVSALRQPHAAGRLGPAPRRPRLTDYIAAGSASGPRKEMKKAAFVANKIVADADTDAGPSPALTPERAMPTGCAISPTKDEVNEWHTEHIPAETVIERSEASVPGFAMDDAEAPSYALVDADGNFIELTSLKALRVAFADLFSDRSLSPDQILGLWESNEIARQQLVETFGEAAVETSVARWSAADAQSKRPRLSQPAGAIVSHRFLTPTHRIAVVGSSAGSLELKINPAWSDEKVLHHYQAHLLKMRLQRADAAAFVDFRLSNQPIEERLRTRLPHLMNAIDEAYRWASTESQ
jgi:hypothetical protein